MNLMVAGLALTSALVGLDPQSEAVINRVIQKVAAYEADLARQGAGDAAAGSKISAEGGSPAVAVDEHEPEDAASKHIVYEDRNDPAYQIGKELRCPVCQGMTIADSPVDMAQDMMSVVRKMVDEGKGKDEILAHFTRSYGDWILLRPRGKGVAMMVWLMPPLMVLLAALLFALYLRGVQKSATAPSAVAGGGAKPASARQREEDPYLNAIRDELDD